MYGTVARLRAKPGAQAEIATLAHEMRGVKIPGLVADYIYRSDNAVDEHYMAVVFESKAAYVANAHSPEQDARCSLLIRNGTTARWLPLPTPHRQAYESKKEVRMTIEANKAVIRAFVESWNTGDLTRLGELMAEECRLTVGGQSFSCGPSVTREIAAHWRNGFPDWRFHLEDLIAEGDKVVARMPFTGTQTGPVLDIPPTGKKAQVNEIVIFRVVEGKIVEAWEEYDEIGMRRQLGALP